MSVLFLLLKREMRGWLLPFLMSAASSMKTFLLIEMGSETFAILNAGGISDKNVGKIEMGHHCFFFSFCGV